MSVKVTTRILKTYSVFLRFIDWAVKDVKPQRVQVFSGSAVTDQTRGERGVLDMRKEKIKQK